jgi:manganese transport protein
MTTGLGPASRTGLSLEEVHGSVALPKSRWRRMLAFAGPAFLVSVGYMDPGNWGTDLEAGSRYGYRLLWVLLMSNLMAILLQSLATRLGVATGRDLAQACRENYPRPTSIGLWILCEIAIASCDLAEVIGTIIALKLLFGLPYLGGLAVAAMDTLLLLAMQKRGMRLLELLTLMLIGVIAVSFFVQIGWANPEWGEVVRGFVPGLPGANATEQSRSLYLAIGILGATVMPHNLYLHSALVQTRAFRPTPDGKREAIRYNLLDSAIALNGAFLVNAAILIVAGAKFGGKEVSSLQDAHRLLHEVLGTALAPILFAIALLASGQSSTFTGTLAGQVVMEGFIDFRLRPWVRRLLSRCLALLPALFVVVLAGGEGVTHFGREVGEVDQSLLTLLVFSQVVLSFQLPFAIFPLIHFTSDKRGMGEFALRGLWKALAWVCGIVVVGLNAVYLALSVGDWGEAAGKLGWNPLLVYIGVGAVAAGLAVFLTWITLYPMLRRRPVPATAVRVPVLAPVRYRRIGVAVEFVPADDVVLAQATALARIHSAELVAVHVVEGPLAALHGASSDDRESRDDRVRITALVDHLQSENLRADGALGYGNPPEELVRIVKDRNIDLLVVGSHGHRFLADLALGRTVAPILHDLTIPVLVVPTREERKTQA